MLANSRQTLLVLYRTETPYLVKEVPIVWYRYLLYIYLPNVTNFCLINIVKTVSRVPVLKNYQKYLKQCAAQFMNSAYQNRPLNAGWSH
jgi:hypothetical protein